MNRMESRKPYITGTSKVTSKFQVTIPSEVRKSAGIFTGNEILWRVTGTGKLECQVLSTPRTPQELAGCLSLHLDAIKAEVNPDNLTHGIGEYIANQNKRKD